MKVIALFIGIAFSVFCLAIANNITVLFSSWDAGLQELLRDGFLVLSIFGILAGLLK